MATRPRTNRLGAAILAALALWGLTFVQPILATTTATDIGFNFRKNAVCGSLSDGANQTYVRGADSDDGSNPDAYLVPRANADFGWSSNAANGRNRDCTKDVKLAGINLNDSSAISVFRYDLRTTGLTLRIELCGGDPWQGTSTNTIVVKDNTTTKITISAVSVDMDECVDANGAVSSTTTWLSHYGTATGYNEQTFSSSTLFIELGDGSSAQTGRLAHFRAWEAGGGGGGGTHRPVIGGGLIGLLTLPWRGL